MIPDSGMANVINKIVEKRDGLPYHIFNNSTARVSDNLIRLYLYDQQDQENFSKTNQ